MLKKLLFFYSILSTLYAGSISADPPGKPSINWGNYHFALVEIDQSQMAYEELVKAVHDEITINVSWSVWSGDAPSVARVLLNGNLVWQGSGANKSAEFKLSKGGRYDMVVELENQDGISQSAPKEVIVADTNGSHLAPLIHSWSENNRAYNNSSKKIVGTYFVEWSVFERNYPFDLAPLSNLNHVLYGFIPICGGDGINDSLKAIQGAFSALQKACKGRDDFKVAIHDPWAAILKPQKGVENYAEPYKGNFGQMMAAKKANPQLNILPSIGGWTLSDPFFLMHDKAKRQVFINSVREFLQTWKFFNGVSIDFESPGFAAANPVLGNKEKDGELYINLIKELRAMLDALGKENDRYYLLTSAININHDKLAVVDYGEAAKHLDNIYMMSYDFYGAWNNRILNHHTGLHRSSVNPTHSEHYIEKGIALLLKQGVPAKKLVMGVAAYGHGWIGVHGYKNNNPFIGAGKGPITGTWENGVLDYRDIIDNHGEEQGFEYSFDEQAKAPYLFKPSTGELVTYDDVSSTQAKAEYVLEKGLGGIFHWAMDGDNGDLINAMHQGLGHAMKAKQDLGSNLLPVAKAGADKSATGPTIVKLVASASYDPKGGNLSYQWRQTSGNKLNIENANEKTAMISLPITQKKLIYTFSLTVTDSNGVSSSDSVTVINQVEMLNNSPAVTLPATLYVDEGDSFNLTAKAMDIDGDALDYKWIIPSDFVVLNENAERITLTAPLVDFDANYHFEVQVSDGDATAVKFTQVKVINLDLIVGSQANKCVTIDENAKDYPSWNKQKVYTTETVSHNGLIYRAKWWIQGVEPSFEVEAWELLSNVALPWMAGIAYSGNSQINHNGSSWQAKWWTKDDEPGKSDVWVNIGPASCE